MQPPSALDRPGRLLSALPRGSELRASEWQGRHRLVCAVVMAHLPVLTVLSVRADQPARLLLVALVGALLVAAVRPGGRRRRSLSAALALLTSSAVAVHLLGVQGEISLHYVVVVALLALYFDRVVYALAVAFSFLHRGLLAPLGDAGAGSASAWAWALLAAALVAFECLVLVLLGRVSQRERLDDEQQLRAELATTRTALQEQLDAAELMRAELIATVSHEFRTPLTGIRGSALTLLKRGDRLDKAGRDRLLQSVLDHQERLSRLLENMLLASRATDADPTASAEVDAVAAEVAMLASASRPGAQGISVVVAPGTTARIDRQALHQVLANLLDNALLHGASGQTPIVAGGEDERGVWVTVSNQGRVIDLTSRERLFEPFTQVDSSATRDREGIGVGLYVVRRLVEVYGGSVEAHSDSGWVTIQMRLQAAPGPRRPRGSGRPAQTPVPTRLPTP